MDWSLWTCFTVACFSQSIFVLLLYSTFISGILRVILKQTIYPVNESRGIFFYFFILGHICHILSSYEIDRGPSSNHRLGCLHFDHTHADTQEKNTQSDTDPPYIYISSLSFRAASTDIPDPLSPILPITHRLRQVFGVTSCVLA